MTATLEQSTPVRPTRQPVHPVRQALRLARTELTLMYRYKTALYLAVIMPLIFVLPLRNIDFAPVLPGVDGQAFGFAAFFAVCAATVGILHVSNVYAARREELVLKRLRVSGVPTAAIFGATALSVIAVVAVQSAAIVALIALLTGVLPADPMMLVVSILLTCVIMTLLGAALTRYTRNAESTQMLSMLPFFALVAASGAFVPLELMPGPVASVLGLMPTAPAVALARSAYFGYDFFGGVEGATAATGLDLWMAAGPSLLTLAAWLALSAYALRGFRWDPRQAR
ncbi:MAG: ABC transporter permease [Egibacteraceae bacterium]